MNKKEFFCKLSSVWDESRELEQVMTKISMVLEPWKGLFINKRILDIGSGTGDLGFWVLNVCSPVKILVEVDFAFDMLKKGSAKNKNAFHVCANGEALPFKGDLFDFVLVMGVFPHVENKTLFLNECRRVLVNGGWVIAFHIIPRDKVNEIHKSTGPPVENDLLPPAEIIATKFINSGLTPVSARDDMECWLVSWRKLQ